MTGEVAENTTKGATDVVEKVKYEDHFIILLNCLRIVIILKKSVKVLLKGLVKRN